MEISMKKILKKFDDCNKFSLTGFVLNDITIFDHKTKKYKYTVNEEKIINNFQNIPEELRKHILYYKIISPDEAAVSTIIDIEYYFELNEDTKKYLLKFRNDFCLEPLEDLAIYKDDELKFWSCTHEEYNSIEINYKNMANEEIADFINDNYFNEDNSVIIETINKLIEMPFDKQFSFKEFGIEDSRIIFNILHICNYIQLWIERIEKIGIRISQEQQALGQLYYDKKYDEFEQKLKKYNNKYQHKEGYYKPLFEEFEQDYYKDVLFKKTENYHLLDNILDDVAKEIKIPV